MKRIAIRQHVELAMRSAGDAWRTAADWTEHVRAVGVAVPLESMRKYLSDLVRDGVVEKRRRQPRYQGLSGADLRAMEYRAR